MRNLVQNKRLNRICELLERESRWSATRWLMSGDEVIYGRVEFISGIMNHEEYVIL